MRDRLRFLHSVLMILFLAPGIVRLSTGAVALVQPVSIRTQFVDVAQEAGIDFIHVRSPTPEKYLVEVMGSGCAFIDFDGDGWLDIFLVNGGEVPNDPHGGPIKHALYRNLGDGTFEDVTAEAGVAGNFHYGMGVAVGDYNNSGFDDLYITYFGGPNQLYRNNGDGTFTDVTEASGTGGDGLWSTSAAFLDYDNDGWLDLYVVRYLDFTFENNLVCGPVREKGFRTYCSPKVYGPHHDLLFRNNRNGTFTDVSLKAGIAKYQGRGLGVVAADLDEDGWMDIYVANDTDPNYLFHNKGDGTFQEIGLLAGVALGEDGEGQSGMGTDCADFDGDGRFDLAVSNLDAPEYLAVYRNLGNLLFEDVSSRTGIMQPSSDWVGFGMGFFDFDNDGELDLFVANGHIDDMIHRINPGRSFLQPLLLFENTGQRFLEVSSRAGNALSEPRLGRGVAFGDYDNDGSLDILVVNSGGRPSLLRNDSGGDGNWLVFHLRGLQSNRNGIGAVVSVTSLEGVRRFQVVGGRSYLSASDYRVHIGLGNTTQAERIEVHWPSGIVDRLEGVKTNQILEVREGQTLSREFRESIVK